MKRLGECLGVAVLAFTFVGCGSGAVTPQVDAGDVAPDGRPAGFEDMMKGMGGQMKKGANSKAAAAATKGAANSQDQGNAGTE